MVPAVFKALIALEPDSRVKDDDEPALSGGRRKEVNGMKVKTSLKGGPPSGRVGVF